MSLVSDSVHPWQSYMKKSVEIKVFWKMHKNLILFFALWFDAAFKTMDICDQRNKVFFFCRRGYEKNAADSS